MWWPQLKGRRSLIRLSTGVTTATRTGGVAHLLGVLLPLGEDEAQRFPPGDLHPTKCDTRGMKEKNALHSRPAAR